jgi:tetratricopeptide (TPR) repeat protein
MTASDHHNHTDVTEYAVEEPDRLVTAMKLGIAFTVICILCVVLYAVLVGAVAPSAPRTLAENSLLQAKAAVKKWPGSGKAWGALAGARYASGDTKGAWQAIKEGQARVKDQTILWVNSRELDMLILENKNSLAASRAAEAIKVEAKFRVQELAENAKKGISEPQQNNPDQTESIRLFVLKATAEGNLGQWKEATKTLTQALEFDSMAADIIRMRGWAELRAGDKAAAKKDFQRTLVFLRDDPSAKQGLAEASK